MSEDLVRDVPMTVLADAEERGKWTKFLTRSIDVTITVVGTWREILRR